MLLTSRAHSGIKRTMSERNPSRRLGRVARYGGPAMVAFLGLVGLNACGGGETEESRTPIVRNTETPPSLTQEPQVTAHPTAEASATETATATQVIPTETPTSIPTVSPEPSPTAELTPESTPEMTLEQAIAKLDSIIYEVQNPDPEIAANYDPPVAWEIRLNTILEGSDDPPIVGLYDVREALIQGDIELAKQRMREGSSEGLFRGIFGRIISPMSYSSGEDEPTVLWKEEELRTYDPQRIFTQTVSGVRLAEVRAGAAIGFLDLYSGLESLSS